MTTVVWDGKALATDCAATDGQTQWKSKKAWYHSDERGICIIAGAGPLKSVLAMRDWYKAGAYVNNWPDIQHTVLWSHLLVVTGRGLIRYENFPIAIEHGFEPCAFGEGRDFALGAMAMGADAATAVKIANDYSPNSGLGVDVFILGERTDD